MDVRIGSERGCLLGCGVDEVVTSAGKSDAERGVLAKVSDESYTSFPFIKSMVEKFAPKGLGKLYKAIASHPEASRLLPTDALRTKARNAQLAHWLSLFSGPYNAAAVQRSMNIGQCMRGWASIRASTSADTPSFWKA